MSSNSVVKWAGTAALAVAVALPAVLAVAQDKAPPKPEAKKAANADPAQRRASNSRTRAAEQALLAHNLARYADVNKDAIAMIAAARMLRQSGVREAKPDPRDEADNKGTDMKVVRDDSVNGLLARARQYAGGRTDLLAMVAEVEKEGTRGDVEGPGCFPVRLVNSNGRFFYNITFRGGQPAIVTLRGDGDSDLDIYVRDAFGNVVCFADGPTDREACRWFPMRTEPFRVEIRNLGIVNAHQVCTN